jgi:chromosome partitioning protein
MRVLVTASRKGGVGKTNFCIQIGVAAEHAGVPTAFVDLDPMAGLSKWWGRRQAETPLLVRAEPDLAAALEHLRALGIGFVVVDTPPAVSQVVADAVGLADLVCVPIQASPDDLDGVEGTLELLSASDTKSIFVMSRVKSRASMTLDVVTALSHHGAVCPVMLADREDFKVSKIRGLSAAEFRASGGAAEDVAALWSQIAQYAGVDDGNTSTTADSQRVGSTRRPKGDSDSARTGSGAKHSNSPGGTGHRDAAEQPARGRAKPPATTAPAAEPGPDAPGTELGTGRSIRSGRRPARPVSP